MDGGAAGDRFVLALDLGTSGVKAALVRTDGAIVGSAVEPLDVTLLPDGGAEQDPEDWWRAICAATAKTLADAGADPADVVGIGLDTQWSGTVPVDAEGRPLCKAIIWMDSRGAGHARRITRGFPSIEGYGARRLLTWIRRTGGAPGHSGKDPVAHILWLRERFPAIDRATLLYLEPKDWVGHRLTGRSAGTFDGQTLHWVTDTRRIDDVRYDRKLLRMTGLDRSKLPDMVPASSVLGTLTERAASDLGLGTHVKVVAGTGDIFAAAIGSGAVRDFDGHLCIGTSSWLVCHVPYKKTDLFHNMASLPSAIPGRYLLSNEQESAGICLTTVLENVLLADDDLSAGPPPDDAYERAFAMASRVPAGSDGLVFLPWLNGERSPVDDHLVRGGFANMSLTHTRAHLVRAVLEGVACNSRWLLMYVERFTKRKMEAITAIGGGARSDLWCQIHADVLDRIVLQAEEPRLANARGAAFQALVALGYLRWDELPDRVPIRRAFHPDPAHRATYDRLFEAFRTLYTRTRKVSASLNRH